MIWFTLIIPFVISVILYFIIPDSYYNSYKKPYIIYIMTPTAALLLSLIYGIMICDNMYDTEYLSYYYTKIRHYDSWNERVTKHKTRTVIRNGRSTTETYTVRKTVNHPESWEATLNNNHDIHISEKEFNRIHTLWKSPEVFVDMHRHYYTKDGDAQDYYWNKKKEHIQIYTKTHEYVNPIVGSDSQFKYNTISKNEAQELGLYDYSECKHHSQNPIIGYTKFVTSQNIKNVKYLNAYYGYNKQICFYVLIYPNAPVSIVEDQKAYWQGGNKNEFVICVGIDSLTNKVQWAECFSWQDDITYDVNCKNYLYTQNTLNIDKLSIWLEHNIHLWKRKEFNDFSYLNIELTSTQEIALFTIITVVSIIAGFVIYFKMKK